MRWSKGEKISQAGTKFTHLYSVFVSPTFEFIVQGSSFHVHKALLSKVSKPLERLMNSNMLETQKGQAILEEEDAETFAYFCEWAYTGRYFYIDPCLLRPHERDVQVEVESEGKSSMIIQYIWLTCEAVLSQYPPHAGRSKKDRPASPSPSRSRKEMMRADFDSLAFGESDDENSPCMRFSNNRDTSPTSCLMYHARLYVFADKFDIQQLKRLALKVLHKALARLTPYPEDIEDIVTLISFVYDHTAPARDGREPMRDLLRRYVGCEIESLVEDTRFQLLLSNNPDFLKDFCSQVSLRS